jgi:ElaB/YqjD/DUF883 family membrane-anchored ribosome-binding protein
MSGASLFELIKGVVVMTSQQHRFGDQNSAQETAQAVVEKAEGIGAAIADTAKAAGQRVADVASTAAETAERAWDATRQTAQDAGSQVADRAQALHSDAVIFIRSNPLATVFGALGIGILLGATLGCIRR